MALNEKDSATILESIKQLWYAKNAIQEQLNVIQEEIVNLLADWQDYD